MSFFIVCFSFCWLISIHCYLQRRATTKQADKTSDDTAWQKTLKDYEDLQFITTRLIRATSSPDECERCMQLFYQDHPLPQRQPQERPEPRLFPDSITNLIEAEQLKVLARIRETEQRRC